MASIRFWVRPPFIRWQIQPAEVHYPRLAVPYVDWQIQPPEVAD
jgi:hypothetical protein